MASRTAITPSVVLGAAAEARALPVDFVFSAQNVATAASATQLWRSVSREPR